MSYQEKEELALLEQTETIPQIILYNDDVNTFEFVIDSLVELCEHNLLQAEQCTYLVHYNGKCSVKKGSFDKLEPICRALLDRGLSARIEN
jgi:ATP-dependent Clp protease adaptor protein ClpS